MKVNKEEGVIDKKKRKKIQGVLNPKILGRGRGRGLRDQLQNYEENFQLYISEKNIGASRRE